MPTLIKPSGTTGMSTEELYPAGYKPPVAVAGVPGVPATVTTSGVGGPTQDRANIDYLLNPYFDTAEVRQNAAEQNLGQGVAGSGFGVGTTNRLLDSERIKRFQLGHEMLDPYLNRELTASEGAANRASELQRIAAQGAQALQQLQLQEAGQTARATAEQNAALQRQVLAGNQAMAQLSIREAGDTGRNNASIAGNLANTRLNIGGNVIASYIRNNPAGTGSVTSGGFIPVTASGQPINSGPAAYNPAARGVQPSSATNTIDAILSKYGLL